MDSLLWSKVDSSSFTLSKASTTFVLVSLSFCHAWLSKSFSSFFLFRTVERAFRFVIISTFIEVSMGKVNCCC